MCLLYQRHIYFSVVLTLKLTTDMMINNPANRLKQQLRLTFVQKTHTLRLTHLPN